MLTQLSFLENWAPTTDELAAFQQQRAAEPSPSGRTSPMDGKLLLVLVESEGRGEPSGGGAETDLCLLGGNCRIPGLMALMDTVVDE